MIKSLCHWNWQLSAIWPAILQGFNGALPPAGLHQRILDEIEKPLLHAALAATNGNQIRTADLLGLNRNTVRKKIRDLGIAVYKMPRAQG